MQVTLATHPGFQQIYHPDALQALVKISDSPSTPSPPPLSSTDNSAGDQAPPLGNNPPSPYMPGTSSCSAVAPLPRPLIDDGYIHLSTPLDAGGGGHTHSGDQSEETDDEEPNAIFDHPLPPQRSTPVTTPKIHSQHHASGSAASTTASATVSGGNAPSAANGGGSVRVKREMDRGNTTLQPTTRLGNSPTSVSVSMPQRTPARGGSSSSAVLHLHSHQHPQHQHPHPHPHVQHASPSSGTPPGWPHMTAESYAQQRHLMQQQQQQHLSNMASPTMVYPPMTYPHPQQQQQQQHIHPHPHHAPQQYMTGPTSLPPGSYIQVKQPRVFEQGATVYVKYHPTPETASVPFYWGPATVIRAGPTPMSLSYIVRSPTGLTTQLSFNEVLPFTKETQEELMKAGHMVT